MFVAYLMNTELSLCALAGKVVYFIITVTSAAQVIELEGSNSNIGL